MSSGVGMLPSDWLRKPVWRAQTNDHSCTGAGNLLCLSVQVNYRYCAVIVKHFVRSASERLVYMKSTLRYWWILITCFTAAPTDSNLQPTSKRRLKKGVGTCPVGAVSQLLKREINGMWCNQTPWNCWLIVVICSLGQCSFYCFPFDQQFDFMTKYFKDELFFFLAEQFVMLLFVFCHFLF